MTAESFRALHHGSTPLVLPNAWDPVSARLVAAAGFPAVATSSGAVARVIGYDDNERTPPAEMFGAIRRIARAVDLPVTADVERGYGLAPRELVGRLLEAGAVGCNLEDSEPATETLVEPARQADFLAAVRAEAGADLVINARIDSFFARSNPAAGEADPTGSSGSKVADAVARGILYRRAGADCVYPIFAPVETIKELATSIGGPVNAHATPDGPTSTELAALGATRISYGTSLHKYLVRTMAELLPSLHA